MGVRLLRDVALATRVLILLELRRRPVATLAPLSGALGLTVQAVSGYLKQLEKSGLVERRERIWRVTPGGEEFLRSEMTELKSFTDDAVRELVVIRSCVAIARAPVRAGDRVGLFMEDGRLVCYPGRRSPSTGVARTDAQEGKDALVAELEGVVEIPEAHLVLIEAPSPEEGGSSAVDRGWLKETMSRLGDSRSAALDEVGEALLREAGKHGPIEFAPLESAVAAVRRGVTVTYFGSQEVIARLAAAIEAGRAEGKLRDFHFRIERAPRLRGRPARKRS